jgi:hypothetical protein
MLEKRGIPLAEVPGFPEDAARQLARLWITTAEEFVDAGSTAEGLAGLGQHFGATLEDAAALVQLAGRVLPKAAVSYDIEAVEEYPLGALDEPEETVAGWRALDFDIAVLPVKVDYHDRLPPVRDQRPRETCVAFAALAARECMLGSASTGSDLSEQFLQWASKQRDGYPGDEKTTIRAAVAALKEVGVCLEQTWPYRRATGGYPPPIEASEQALSYRISDEMRLPPERYACQRMLADGLLVIFTATVHSYWWRAHVCLSGDIRLPLVSEQGLGLHAMCMVGYEDDASVPGGGCFFVRNSWGENWAWLGTVAPGYCRVPYQYIQEHTGVAYVLQSA